MKQFKLVALLIVAAFAFASCEKEDDMHDHDHDGHDHAHIDIDIMSPTDGQTYPGGSDTVTVHLHIEMDADETIHNVEIIVVDQTDESNVYSFSDHVHAEDGTFSHHADVEIFTEAHTDYLVTARVLDHDNVLEKSESRGFHVHP